MAIPSVGTTKKRGEGSSPGRYSPSPASHSPGDAMLREAIACLQESNRIRRVQMAKEVQELDLLVQEEQQYTTLGSETNFTLTLQNQSTQQERIHSFYLGCTGTDANIASLITTGVTGYVQMGPVVVNFNEPSVLATQQDILLRSDSNRIFHVAIATGNFPAGLKFYALLSGIIVPSEYGQERPVLH